MSGFVFIHEGIVPGIGVVGGIDVLYQDVAIDMFKKTKLEKRRNIMSLN